MCRVYMKLAGKADLLRQFCVQIGWLEKVFTEFFIFCMLECIFPLHRHIRANTLMNLSLCEHDLLLTVIQTLIV